MLSNRWKSLAAAVALCALMAVSAGVAIAQDDAGPAALALGAGAPQRETSMLGVDGRSFSIAKSAGPKGTLVLFICNHCPWVKAWQGRIAAIGNDALKRGVGVIAINSNDPDALPEDAYAPMQQRAKDVGYRFPYVVDATSDVARAFGATHTPEAFLFDAHGRLVYHGAVDDDARDIAAVKSHWLADAVTAVATGRPVPAAETKALGCGIKLRAKRSS